ncbi:MAG: exodeoxyribonuclease VII small subunit [Marvinbryantia sp.]|jgi:exodeoxyribonuclease VII small subunit
MAEKKAKKEQELTLEQSFEKLEELLTFLESREITLEESFAAYQKGMELLKHCNEKIDQVEKKMQVLGEEGELHEF